MIRFDRLMDVLMKTLLAVFALAIIWIFYQAISIPLEMLWLEIGIVIGLWIGAILRK